MLVGGAEEEPLSWRWGKEDGYMLFEYSSIVGDEEEDVDFTPTLHSLLCGITCYGSRGCLWPRCAPSSRFVHPLEALIMIRRDVLWQG